MNGLPVFWQLCIILPRFHRFIILMNSTWQLWTVYKNVLIFGQTLRFFFLSIEVYNGKVTAEIAHWNFLHGRVPCWGYVSLPSWLYWIIISFKLGSCEFSKDGKSPNSHIHLQCGLLLPGGGVSFFTSLKRSWVADRLKLPSGRMCGKRCCASAGHSSPLA